MVTGLVFNSLLAQLAGAGPESCPKRVAPTLIHEDNGGSEPPRTSTIPRRIDI